MLIVLQLGKHAPQRVVHLQQFGNALPLGVHLRRRDGQRIEDETDRARNENRDHR
ncbi:MAG: hypothetical protein ACKOEC_19790 [Acidimicrobiia bacterium]